MPIRSPAYIGVFSCACALACSASGTTSGLHDYGPAELYAGTSSGGASSGGASNGGSSGMPSGGMPSAGAGSPAGASNGGASASGGASSSAGASTGGASTGGASTGGMPSGGMPSGGMPSGGAPSGGKGGSATGGSSTGGSTGTEQLLSRGKTATADSEQTADGNTAAMGNDGVLSTRWCAADAATGHYWQVDLGAAHQLSRITISWEKVEIYQFKLEGSADQSTWTTLSDQTASTDDNSDQSFTLTGSPNARYVKITVTGLNGGAWASFFELSVYGY